MPLTASTAARFPLHLVCCAWLVAGQASAQTVGVPGFGSAFRPQPIHVAPHPNTVASTGAATSADKGAASDPDSSGLRMLLIGGSRNAAAIDGRVVHVGDKVQGMRVAQIGPNGVTLVGEGGAREVLHVHPAAKKLPVDSTRLTHGARP